MNKRNFLKTLAGIGIAMTTFSPILVQANNITLADFQNNILVVKYSNASTSTMINSSFEEYINQKYSINLYEMIQSELRLIERDSIDLDSGMNNLYQVIIDGGKL